MVSQEQYDKMTIQDREAIKFNLDPDWKVSVRISNQTLQNNKWYFSDISVLMMTYPVANLWDNAVVNGLIYFWNWFAWTNSGIRIDTVTIANMVITISWMHWDGSPDTLVDPGWIGVMYLDDLINEDWWHDTWISYDIVGRRWQKIMSVPNI